MKLLLVIPRDRAYTPVKGFFSKPISYAPLTLTLLAALVPPEYEVAILDEGVDSKRIDWTVDVMAFSVLTATAKRAYKLAQQARSKGIYVVMGGVHATLMPEEVKRHADTVIIGQADDTWPQFLKDFLQGKPRETYKATSKLNLTSQPFLRRDLLLKGAYLPVPTLQASRGCPNRCQFCAISHHTNHQTLERPVSAVVAEIEALNTKRVLFLDPNFTVNRHYAITLMRELIPLKIEWGCLCNATIAEDEPLLQLMEDSGCRGVLVGFESICQLTLIRMHKAFNRAEKYQTYIQRFHKHGMAVLGCFVFGFDTDQPDVFRETVDFVLTSGIDLPRFSVLTPFPGTPLFEKLKQEGRIFDLNWNHYDFQQVVFCPKYMSADTLQQGLEWAWRETYGWDIVLKRSISTPNLKIMSLLANMSFKKYGDNISKMRQVCI